MIHIYTLTMYGLFMFFASWLFVVPCMGADTFDFEYPLTSNAQMDNCQPSPLGRVPWILHVRQPDYGWKEHSHRANIALAVNRYQGSPEDMTKMGLQLEQVIINSLLKNTSSGMHENDLALFIHALIATQKNPRNFHGIDLVADLLHRVDSKEDVHPFIVLALCNSRAVDFNHLRKIIKYTYHNEANGTLGTREAEMKALALKALACAGTIDIGLNKFGESMDEAAKCLVSKQKDGVFGNAYTTSLAVQALTAYGQINWDEEKALEFLEKESVIKVNMVKAYYIEMALNARRVKFIKDLYNGPYAPESPTDKSEYYVQYTIREDINPDFYFSVTMRIPNGSNFFDVMQKGSELNNRFNFSHYMNKNNEPMVYAVAGKPNDAENNMFWRICRQTDADHDRHTSNITTFSTSPVQLVNMQNEHIILWYRQSDCPRS